MRKVKTFRLTQDHLTLLRNSKVSEELSGMEYGAAEIDPKYPYGGGDVELDMAELLGVELVDGEYLSQADRRRLCKLHGETPIALQIVLQMGEFRPGVFTRNETWMPWQRVGDPREDGVK